MSSLPPPAVSPDAYDERYYRETCAGYEEWAATDGAGASGVYAGTLEMARFARGEVVLDLGTGRGELLAVAVERGAARAIGVEYSPDAVRLARQTLASRGVEDRCEVVLADARDVPLEDGIADLVTLIDVVEHLTPAELDLALAQARRLLAPGGRLIAHTMPNRRSTRSPTGSSDSRGRRDAGAGPPTRATPTSTACTSTSRPSARCAAP